MRAFLVDDEPPAIERLHRLLGREDEVEVIGTSTDAIDAVETIERTAPDLLFLDIHMPELSGFDLLARLTRQPLVIVTTAYDQHALEAFGAHSIDYLLKPVEPERLRRALQKAARFLRGSQEPADAPPVLAEILALLRSGGKQSWLSRVASRVGDRVEVVDVSEVTHFFARDKLTFAATAAATGKRPVVVDQTIVDLETRLDPSRFVRIHRGVILNLDHLLDLQTDFGGRLIVRLKGASRTPLVVARDRVATLKGRLGL